MEEKKQEEFEQWTANQWRTGINLRGETFHAWLTEMVEKYDLEYGTLNRFYEEIRRDYMKENNITAMVNVHNKDYVAITKRVEDALANWYPTYPVNIVKRRGEVGDDFDWIRIIFKVIVIPLLVLFVIAMICLGYLMIEMTFGG